MKEQTMTSIDGELKQKAKDRRLNISEVLEQALSDKLNKKEVEIDTTMEKCEFCGRPDKKATRDNPNEGLTWLWPDERWICAKCLKKKSVSICK